MLNYNISENQLETYSDRLSNIKLYKSAIIISPYSIIDNFKIKLRKEKRLKEDKFIFEPELKISLPVQLVPNFISNIKGLYLIHIDYIKRDVYPGTESQYYSIIYSDFKFYFNIIDRVLFTSNQFMKIKNIIPEEIEILSFDFLYRFRDRSDDFYPKLEETYIIINKYLYDRFPDF